MGSDSVLSVPTMKRRDLIRGLLALPLAPLAAGLLPKTTLLPNSIMPGDPLYPRTSLNYLGVPIVADEKLSVSEAWVDLRTLGDDAFIAEMQRELEYSIVYGSLP